MPMRPSSRNSGASEDAAAVAAAADGNLRRRVCNTAFAASVVFRNRPVDDLEGGGSGDGDGGGDGGDDGGDGGDVRAEENVQTKRRRRSSSSYKSVAANDDGEDGGRRGSDEKCKEGGDGNANARRKRRRSSTAIQSYEEASPDLPDKEWMPDEPNTAQDKPNTAQESQISLPKGLMKERTMDVLKRSVKRKFRYLIILPGQLQAASEGRLGYLDRMDSMNPILYLDIAPQGGDDENGSDSKSKRRRRLKLQGSIVHPKSTLISLRVSSSEAVCEDVFDTAIVFGEVTEEEVEVTEEPIKEAEEEAVKSDE